ncbi:MAG: 30S ribosomal protein S12 methylthiotransferase RimO [Pirellulales bacterium]|nr:30S ribosomal protein S12 methylthiotransferase RimO [Pirellulales bacterium]
MQTAEPSSKPKGRYVFIALGCSKNLVDSERMLGLLQRDGYDLVSDPQEADFAIINTCGFIASARTESLAVIDEMIALKQRGRLRGVIVSGCLAERDRESLLEQRPDIDHLIGVFCRDEVVRCADQLVGRGHATRALFRDAPDGPMDDRSRFRITPRHFAYLKISEGCDRHCTFCTIPAIRGHYVSKPIRSVIIEAEELATDGVRELILVAQDTSAYGIDLTGKSQLADLLRALVAWRGVDWIRLMYLYPMHITDDLVDTIAANERILPYLDLPLQHINDRMLRRMQRQVSRLETERLLARLRDRIPELVLRTTLMTGFPGETDVEFAELSAFVQAQRFERLGVFTYSNESSTPAAKMAGQIPEEIKIDRRARLMTLQQSIAFEFADGQIGKTMDVFLDEAVPDTEDAWIGRTWADAPEVDPIVYVTGKDLAPGQLVPCEIVARNDYDLIGVAVGPPR